MQATRWIPQILCSSFSGESGQSRGNICSENFFPSSSFCAQWLSSLGGQVLSDLIHTLFLHSKEVEFQIGMSYTEPTRRTLRVQAIATVHP